MTDVTILADSIGDHGSRLTSVQCRFPRVILAQVRTYGMLAYSVRSSRAVPVGVMLREVQADPFVPAVWRKAVKGMTAGEELSADSSAACRETWLSACEAACERATGLFAMGAAKEHANRLLEPFAWSWAVITGTGDAWRWLFAQRCHEDAQPEFQWLACAIRGAMARSFPKWVGVGDWHLPYVTEYEAGLGATTPPPDLSAARCARVSYRPFDGTEADPVKDATRAATLWSDKHLGPFDHPAMCVAGLSRPGKFLGWMSYRTRRGY